jgi:hypothetical protein
MCPMFNGCGDTAVCVCVCVCVCLNVTHKKPYKRYEGKINDVLIAFIDYVNELNKLQQFKVSV